MNHSIYNADRRTHLKIVVVTLAAAIMILGITITAHVGAKNEESTQTVHIIKAGKPVMMTSNNTMVR